MTGTREMRNAAETILIFALALVLAACAGHKKPESSAGAASQRDSRAAVEAQQAEQQMMQLQQGAQSAKVLSEADTQNPNALTALLQGGQQTV